MIQKMLVYPEVQKKTTNYFTDGTINQMVILIIPTRALKCHLYNALHCHYMAL